MFPTSPSPFAKEKSSFPLSGVTAESALERRKMQRRVHVTASGRGEGGAAADRKDRTAFSIDHVHPNPTQRQSQAAGKQGLKLWSKTNPVGSKP